MIPFERLEALALRLVARGAGTHAVAADPDVDEAVVAFAGDSLGTIEVVLRKAGKQVASFHFDVGRSAPPNVDRPKRPPAGKRDLLQELREAADRDPADFAAWLRLGHACLVSNRIAAAAEALQQAVRLNPRHDLARYFLGHALRTLGRIAEAERCFHQIARSDPKLDHAESHLGLAALLNLSDMRENLNRPLEALESIRPAADLVLQILIRLGRTSMNAGDHASAIRYFEALAPLHPRNPDVLHSLGRSLLWIGRSEDAVPWLARAVKVVTDGVHVWYDLGLAYQRLRRLTEARRAFRRVLRLDPNHVWGWYDLACVDALEGKRDGAFRNLTRAARLGFNRVAHALADRDLDSLRADRRWESLVKTMSNGAGVPPEQ